MGMTETLKRAALGAACVMMAGTFADDASARTRLNFYYGPYYQPGFAYYYGEPVYVPRVRPYRYYRYYAEPPVGWAYNGYYEDDDEAYYEPQYEPNAVPQPVAKPKPVAKPAARSATAKPTTVQKPAKKAAAAKPSLSCEKATEVVSGFGFRDIKPVTCKGQTYAFNATRDGKTYSIKLNAANGELTEVKKL
jgi:hypothetical protein